MMVGATRESVLWGETVGPGLGPLLRVTEAVA